MKKAERAAAGAVSGGPEAAQDAGWGHPAYRPRSSRFGVPEAVWLIVKS